MKYLSILDSHGNKIPIRASVDHEGATTGRRLSYWGTSTSGANTALSGNLTTLRSRSRELLRNNPNASGGMEDYIATVIGTGISPRWQTDDKKINKALLDLWNEWVDECDVYNRLNFYGLQSLCARGLFDAGESIVRFIRSVNKQMTVPLQLQVLEADHLDEGYNTIAENGNSIRLGIEVDSMGVPIAYHLYKDHPGESFIGVSVGQKIRVIAQDIVHIFKPDRAGQMRGRPKMTSVIMKLHDLDQYDDAELVRKKGAAMFGGFIYEDVPRTEHVNPYDYIGEQDENYTDEDIIALEPGTYPRLPKGLKVEFSKPVDVGESYDSWMKKQLRDVAKGMGITYEQITGDLSGVNFSSIRAGINDLRRRVTQFQHEIIIFQLCRRTVNEFLNTVFLNNILPAKDYFSNKRKYRNVIWNTDEWPSIQPLVDARSNLLNVRSGFNSRSGIVAGKGMDVEDVDKENADDRKRETDLGLTYQTNPAINLKNGETSVASE